MPLVIPNFNPIVDTRDDLARACGAFLYFDPTHPYLQMPAGVDFTTVPNLAAPGLTVDPTISVNNALGANGTVERTLRSAVHIIPSRTAPAGTVWQLLMSTEQAAKILAAPDNVYFLAGSFRFTRAAAASSAIRHLARLARDSNNVIVSHRIGSAGTSVYGDPAGNAAPGTAVPGLVRVSVAARGPAALAAVARWFLSIGRLAEDHNAPAAVIVYDLIAGNLSSPGTSKFVQCDAIHAAKHAKMHGPGGRYANDQWTAPN
jgi:hypothetical protein